VSSSPSRASCSRVASWLLAQPALRSKPTFLAYRRGYSWDVSRQRVLPLAYPDSHPHDSFCVSEKLHRKYSRNWTK
jgi:hypothetical protein